MRIVTARRISQVFFLALLVWLCVVATPGERWFQQGGWAVNWLLQLDPLAAAGVGLAAGALTVGLLWALVTVVMTAILGRAFCGWVCPFGTIHQAVGWLSKRGKGLPDKLRASEYHKAQSLKYVILAVLGGLAVVTLQTGLLDPIPLVHRSVQLVVLPAVDGLVHGLWPMQRFNTQAAVIGGMFLGAVLANLIAPRFFCRFLCPLGALLAVLGRFAIWRIGRNDAECANCNLCRADCEGACDPPGRIRTAECVLCMNCVDKCPRGVMTYQTRRSLGGEIAAADISRRGVLLSLASGIAAGPIIRLAGKVTTNWNPSVIRPPGSLAEADFLNRCIKCGQCMRVCPTNVLQPAGLAGGIEGLWAPVLNNRIGTSGCQLNCVACGQVCPTGAIRPISLDEKLGLGEFTEAGPIRLGTAFVDRGRCLPWAMNTPCIVCEENCPVSPKAIIVEEAYLPVPDGTWTMAAVSAEGDWVRLAGTGEAPDFGAWTTGDYFAKPVGAGDEMRRPILEVDGWAIRVPDIDSWRQAAMDGRDLEVRLRLQRPVMDPARCIGCGVCEHECPVSGLRAIRVTAENETRSPARLLLL